MATGKIMQMGEANNLDIAERNRTELWMSAGYRVALEDGCLVSDSPYHMATELFYPVSKGDYIEYNSRCGNTVYEFAVATFSCDREEKYIYSYDYKKDSAWVTYRQDLTPQSYSGKKYVFEEDGYCRICVKRCDGAPVTQEDAEKINDILHFYTAPKRYRPKECFISEIEETVREVRQLRNQYMGKKTDAHTDLQADLQREEVTAGMLSLCILTDSHYTVNGTWEDTADNIQKTLDRTGADAIVHLGDFTDGMTSKAVTTHYVEKMLTDLRKNKVPVYVTLGNHDSNYFRGNTQRLSKEEQRKMFGIHKECYYRDFDGQRIRCLFLTSYDVEEPVRYGFSQETVEWVKKTLEETPKDYKVIIFAHEAPLDNLDYWARIIRNGKNLMDVMEGETLYFVRFGAGENRVVDCHKRESTWRQEREAKRKRRTTKIWAHRGSSGFAPENTMPSFVIAKELDVDGIELDVQMTKDGELVVIHDETIDRVSDGKGMVKDFCLEELRQYNFAKNKPIFGFVTIPTLREVYELFRDTDYIINVELKTGVVAYDGSEVTVGRPDPWDGVREKESDCRCIEEKVHELTVEMGMEKRVIYSSFNHMSVLKLQKYITEEQTAFLFRDGWMDAADYAEKYKVQAMHPYMLSRFATDPRRMPCKRNQSQCLDGQ